MRVLLVVLALQVLAVVVAVGRAHDGVHVLAEGEQRIGDQVPHADRTLVVEFDQNHRAVAIQLQVDW